MSLPVTLSAEDSDILMTRVPSRARENYTLFDILDFYAARSWAERPGLASARHRRLATRGLHWRIAELITTSS